MITVKFTGTNRIKGFELCGHGTEHPDDTEGRIVCSAVSSAVYLTANTISEIVGAEIDAFDDGDRMKITVLDKVEESQTSLLGLRLHLTELSKQYKNTIKIISEV